MLRRARLHAGAKGKTRAQWGLNPKHNNTTMGAPSPEVAADCEGHEDHAPVQVPPQRPELTASWKLPGRFLSNGFRRRRKHLLMVSVLPRHELRSGRWSSP